MMNRFVRERAARERGATTTVAKTGPNRLTYAGITSTIAILLSSTSWYFTWFHEKHSLKLVIVRANETQLGGTRQFAADVVVLNHGNKKETVLLAEMSFDNPEREARMFEPLAAAGPFVLDAGAALPIRLHRDLEGENFDFWMESLGPAQSFRVSLHLSVLASDGSEIRRVFNLGLLGLAPPASVFVGLKDTEHGPHELF